MFGTAFRKKNPARLETVERIQGWTRERFKLPLEIPISVSELDCQIPGCPPLETAVSFWEGEQRYHFKVFKRLEEIVEGDLPYSWMKEAIQVPEGWQCDCC
jgi:hypothetical protein